MRCPYCGANVNGAVCEYCDSVMPVERVEPQSIHAENVVVNNYYYQDAPESEGYANQDSSWQDSDPYDAYPPYVSDRSRLVALLFCVFLGFFGAHRFYAGRYLMGVIYLLTAGLLGIGWIVDMVLIALGRMRDRNGLPIENW